MAAIERWRCGQATYPGQGQRSRSVCLVNPALVTVRFQQLARDAEQTRIRLHDLRHSWASLALNAGLSPKVVQERLDHANISTTLTTYSHVSKETHRSAAEQLGGLMFGTTTPPS